MYERRPVTSVYVVSQNRWVDEQRALSVSEFGTAIQEVFPTRKQAQARSCNCPNRGYRLLCIERKFDAYTHTFDHRGL